MTNKTFTQIEEIQARLNIIKPLLATIKNDSEFIKEYNATKKEVAQLEETLKQQILERSAFLHSRIELAKEKGASYFYPTELFNKEIKELRSLRKEYKNLTGDWLVHDMFKHLQSQYI